MLGYLQIAFTAIVIIALGTTILFILAGTLGRVITSMPIAESNPLSQLTQAWTDVSEAVVGLLVPLAIIGIAIAIVLAVMLIARVFTG